jgi:S-adenosylmethionine:tRNA ribosyltransferase-isomerase
VTAVGTTSVRTLETIFQQGRTLLQGPSLKGSTDILIQPGYEFQRVNSLITNFHLPGTSLLLLVEAFVGSTAHMQRIYNHAIAEKYRFYSFGDCMLIL